MAGQSTIPASARQPADRLGKTPRTRTVSIPMDDDAAQALEDAQAELDQARYAKTEDRDSRVAGLMAARRAPGVVLDLEDVRREVDAAIEAELKPLAEHVAKTAAAVDATSKRFTFHALGHKTYQALLTAHKPTDDDHEQVKAEGSGTRALFHAETFGPALVKACSADPVLTDDDIAEIFDGGAWNLSEIGLLFMAAYEVNTQRRVVRK